MAYDNNMTGTLFRNDEKREGKQDSDYRGQCEIAGAKYWISAWINTSKKDGTKYMRLTFKEQEARAEKPAEVPAGKPEPEFNDDIPF